MPERLDALTVWLRSVLCNAMEGASRSTDFQISPASADASFRRYFRVTGAAVSHCFGESFESLIVMDAPPEKEDSHPFVAVATMLAEIGVNVPRVLAKNFEQGFLLLTDLGTQAYLDVLKEQTVERLYADALDALLLMQANAPRNSLQDVSQNTLQDTPAGGPLLPAYDATLLLQEMELFRNWYCRQYRKFSFSDTQQAELNQVFQQLCDAALAQPQVFVHRDYHSRNLMVSAQHNPGILDFQDAVVGPVTYDLVSLLRDCYINWPRQRVERWALDYLHRAADAGLISHETDATFLQWFDWMGVQRHLKASGIFARLYLRDHKPGYLGDIPRTLAYVQDVSSRYPQLGALHHLLNELVS